jgi:hypothetical protein
LTWLKRLYEANTFTPEITEELSYLVNVLKQFVDPFDIKEGIESF